ncbi:MAG: hypothetical protein AB8G14_14055 [Ilumatobacter sp.]
MLSTRGISALLVAAVLVGAACAGGGNEAAPASPQRSDIAEPDTAAPDAAESNTAESDAFGDSEAGASIASIDIVWALDGESVGGSFDYSQPIARDRYEAGLRLDVAFAADGEVGNVTTDLSLAITINGDRIQAGSTFGPEQSATQPDRDEMNVITSESGFTAQFPIGRPLSPISLRDARDRAVEFGLDPDDEVIEFDDTDISFNASGLLDFPAAPIGGSNDYVIELSGTVRLGNGVEIDVDEGVARSEVGERLMITETQTVAVPATRDCSVQTERYLELLDEELANTDIVLLDRSRAFLHIADEQRDNDCGVREFSIPVCDAAQASSGPTLLLEPHLRLCPDDLELVEATVFEPRFDDGGTVRLVVPRTSDGLPAYSVAMSFPLWSVQTTSEGPTRQKIALVEQRVDARFVRIDVDVSAMPASLLEERAAAAVEPESADAQILLSDTITIADLPARRLIAQLDDGVYQVGTAIELDAERLLTISGRLTSTPDLPIDGEGLAALLTCIETSVVVAPFETGVDLEPAGDCIPITEYSTSEPTPDPAAQASASFDGSVISLTVPGTIEELFHVVTVAAPAWESNSVRETVEEQVIKLDPDGGASSFVRATASMTENYQASEAELAAPPFDDWTTVSDEMRPLGAREMRVVVRDWDGKNIRRGVIIVQIDSDRMLVVEVNVDAADDVEFDLLFDTALDSLSISP